MLLLGSLVYLLVLLGLATFRRELLVLAIPLLVYLAAALPLQPREPRLSVERSLVPDRVMEGARVTVLLSVTNESSRPHRLTVQDLVPPRLVPDAGRCLTASSLAPGETLVLTYGATPPRGAYSFHQVQVTLPGPLGLTQRTLALAAPGRLLVLPRIARLRRLSVRPLRTRGHAGPVPARLGGSGVDFFGVREYQIGDPQRWINWRASARLPSALFTNEFEQERIADVGLLLDARLHSDVGAGPNSLFEHAVHAIASLADVFLRDGNRVALLIFGQYVQWILPGYGKVQRERIMLALAGAELGDSHVFDSLENLPSRLFAAGSQLVLVSPVARDDVPPLLRLRALGYQLLVIRPDRVALETQQQVSHPSLELAASTLRVEAALVRRSLLQAGVQIVDWQVDRPLEQVVHAALRRAAPWTRPMGARA